MQDNNQAEAKKTLPKIIKIVEFFENKIESISAIMLFIVIAATLMQVIFRYIFNAPLLWTEELARYLGIWMIMFATSVALKRRNHIGVDFIANKLSPKGRRILITVNDLLCFVVLTGMTIFSFDLTVKAFDTPSPALRIPIGIVYAGLVIGYGFSALFALFIGIEGIMTDPVSSEKNLEKESDAL